MADDFKLMSAESDLVLLAALEAERKDCLATITPELSTTEDTGYSSRQATKEKKARQEMHQQGLVDPIVTTTKPTNLRAEKETKIDTDAELQTERATIPIDSKPAVTIKPKPKTREEASVLKQELADLNIDGLEDSESQIPEKVPVKKSDFEIFCCLYPRRGGTKAVLWDKFVDAMAKVDFVSRRSGGSAVTFEPSGVSKWYGQGSIVFHRPHPDSSIDPVMLNSVGKRMKKWFGWSKETSE
jgi:hypothetical protein